MSPEDHFRPKVMCVLAVCAIKDNRLYNLFIVLQRDLKDVDFDEFEQQTMDYCYEHVHEMEDNQQLGPKILMISGILGASDIVFAVGVSHHPCSFCASGYV